MTVAEYIEQLKYSIYEAECLIKDLEEENINGDITFMFDDNGDMSYSVEWWEQ